MTSSTQQAAGFRVRMVSPEEKEKVMGRRVVAYLIDGLGFGTLSLAIILTWTGVRLLSASAAGAQNADLADRELLLIGVVVFAFAVAYHTVMEVIWGGSIGKMVTGLRVADHDGNRLDWRQAAIRNALRLVDNPGFFVPLLGMLPYVVGGISALLGEKRQRIGDRMAGTIVYQAGAFGEPVHPVPVVWFRPEAPSPEPTYGNQGPDPAETAAPTSSGGSMLDKYSQDLTARALEGKIGPVIGRQDQVRRMCRTLSRKQKSNPVLTGEPGVGKTAVVEGLARLAAGLDGEVPAALAGKQILELNLSAMEAGTSLRGMFEERLEGIISEASERDDLILFADELHRLMSAGSHSEAASPAAEALKPALARGDLSLIGATTTDEYREIERDAAMERRLQPIKVPPLTVEETVEVLRRIKSKYEHDGLIEIEDEALVAAATWSERYITDRYLPDKAIDLIDEASAGAPDDGLGTVTAANVAAVVQDRTGIKPTGSGEDEEEFAELKTLGDRLGQRVVGQAGAVLQLAETVKRRHSLGYDRPASLLFLGSSGVGKTELAKALAEELFGSEKALIRLNMSEFSNEHSASRLVGAAQGYKDSDEGGQLTEAVRRKPNSVILLDEIEKAHRQVAMYLLQVLDEGQLADGRGREIDFVNTIIIMTSNVGADCILSGDVSPDSPEAQQAMTDELVMADFPPELVGRIERRIVFPPLREEDLEKIVPLLAAPTLRRVRESRKVEVELDHSLVTSLARTATDPRLGARPLREAVEERVEGRLSDLIADGYLGGSRGARHVVLWHDPDAGEDCFYFPDLEEDEGAEASSQTRKVCAACGAEMGAEDRFCRSCGAAVEGSG